MASGPNWKRQALLALVLFIAGSCVYWLEFKQKPKREEAEEGARKIFALKDAVIRTIKMEDGRKSFELGCLDTASSGCKVGDQARWEIRSPRKFKADDGNVNSLITTLDTLTVPDTIDLKADSSEKRASLLESYGLGKDALLSENVRRLTVATQKGDFILYMGSTHPIGDGIFSVVEKTAPGEKPQGNPNTEKVYLIPGFFKSNLDHPLNHWRDKRIMTLSSHEVVSFTLTSSAKVEAHRKDGQWTIHSDGQEATGDTEAIDNILSTVTLLTAQEFVADTKTEPKAQHALQSAKNLASLALKPAKGEPITMTFWEKPEGKGKTSKLFVAASNTDPLYQVDAFTKDRITKDFRALRMKKIITSLQRFAARRLEVQPAGGTNVVITNKEGKWTAADNLELDESKLQILLDRLSGDRVKDFISGAKIPAGQDKGVTLTLGDEKEPAVRKLVFWKVKDATYARDLQSKRTEALLIDSSLSEVIPWQRQSLQKSAPHGK